MRERERELFLGGEEMGYYSRVGETIRGSSKEDLGNWLKTMMDLDDIFMNFHSGNRV